MIDGSKAFSGFSVDDLGRAKEFYGGTLGLEVGEEGGNMWIAVGAGRVFVYAKDNHEAATFTILNFDVDDIEAEVEELRGRGVEFERYEGTEIETDEKGIFRGPGPLIAWFKDPAGNVISLLQLG